MAPEISSSLGTETKLKQGFTLFHPWTKDHKRVFHALEYALVHPRLRPRYAVVKS